MEYDKIRELSNFGIYKGPINALISSDDGENAGADTAKENNTTAEMDTDGSCDLLCGDN